LRELRQWRSLARWFLSKRRFSRNGLATILMMTNTASYNSFLSNHPDVGKVIRASGGIRKLRWAARGRGKRGGLRILYFWWVSVNRISMLMIYAKNETDGLSAAQLAKLRKELEL
jgi:hypothetical protein